MLRHSLAQRSGLRAGDEFLIRCLAMNKTEMPAGASLTVRAPVEVVEREAGLQRGLTPGQLAMIGLGSTIGTGLFLARKIHDFRSTKGLAMVQIRYRGGFETKSEAFT